MISLPKVLRRRHLQEHEKGTGWPLRLVGVFLGLLCLLGLSFATLINWSSSLSFPDSPENKKWTKHVSANSRTKAQKQRSWNRIRLSKINFRESSRPTKTKQVQELCANETEKANPPIIHRFQGSCSPLRLGRLHCSEISVCMSQ